MSSTKEIIDQAMALSAQERAVVVEQLLLSLDAPDPSLDRIWADEAEARLDAYERGELKAVSVQDVMAKYDKK
ncbi:MAG TPA: addiction module protein [Alcanivorax sp.]|nr:addiction module protein [Alcanivorax sp.]